MADTMLSFANNQISNNFLSENDIMAKCPNAFKTEPTNPGVSDKYVQATTIDVIRDMAKLGWYPVEAKQCRSKKGSKGIRSFHMIALQNPTVKVLNNNNEIEGYPRIILTNSHDGFNSFKFMCGYYRLVCSNGLIIADKEFANISIRHINYTFEELTKTVVDILQKLPNQIAVLNDMQNKVLTDEEKTKFAISAIKLRKGYNEEDKVEISQETIDELLSPVRKEDSANNLYNIYNIIQEKIIKGNFHYSEKQKKMRKMRMVTSISKDLDINTNLFNLACSYVRVAA